jgi:hypothetical protein
MERTGPPQNATIESGNVIKAIREGTAFVPLRWNLSSRTLAKASLYESLSWPETGAAKGPQKV